MCSVRLSVRTLPFHGGKRSSILLPSTIVKCYQGIVMGRHDYTGLTVRGIGPDITVIQKWVHQFESDIFRQCPYGQIGKVASLKRKKVLSSTLSRGTIFFMCVCY